MDIALPTADVRPLEPKNGLVVTVDRGGQIFVDEVKLSFDEFAGSIKALSDKKGGGGVYLRADEAVPYGRVVQIVAALKASGITDVGLVAEPESSR